MRKIHPALSPVERAAYLAVRFPSTFAVASRVWRELSVAIPAMEIRSLLDAGAGPGTASLAARQHVGPNIVATQLERDQGWRADAERLAHAAALHATFRQGSLAAIGDRHDVVVACYALGELHRDELDAGVDALWSAATKAFVVIEPGTPQGFDVTRRVRERLLSVGAHAAAPCTHDATCPMSTADWCHSSVRVQRSAVHRAAKEAALGYEDEKLAYVIMAREPPPRRTSGRIVRRPIRAKGHVHLDVCEEEGLRRETIARSNDAYRRARHAVWGGPWPSYDD